MRIRQPLLRFSKRLRTLLPSVAVVLVATPGTGHAQRPQFTISYEQPSSTQNRYLYKYLREKRFLETAATRLNSYLNLRKPVLLTAGSCSKANASFNPHTNTVRLCYELVSEIMDQLSELTKEDSSPPGVHGAAYSLIDEAIPAARFFLYHEVGHALISTLRLPATGRFEDDADQLAILLLEKNFGGPNGYAAADIGEAQLVFTLWARDQRITDDVLTDVHALPDQRSANIACWSYASESNASLRSGAAFLLSTTRADQCEEEWATLRASWTTLLRPFVRRPGGKN